MSNNKISQHFLSEYPKDAARTLEQYSSEQLADYLDHFSAEISADVIKQLVPSIAVECLTNMSLEKSSAIITHLGVERASIFLRRMKSGIRVQFIRSMSPIFANMTRLVLRYPQGTVGQVMNPNVFTAYAEMTVEEVVKIIKGTSNFSSNEIYITGDKQELHGTVDIKQLFTDDSKLPMSKIMQPPGECIPARANISSVRDLSAWNVRESMPVIDHFGVFIGILKRSVVNEYQTPTSMTSMDNEFTGTALAVAELFWNTCANILAPDYDKINKGSKNE